MTQPHPLQRPCPGRCGAHTARTYACRWCWYRLLTATRDRLTTTRPGSVAYRTATKTAATWWTRHPYTRPASR